MKQAVFSGLEAALNQAIKLDPATQERLAELEGKIILIDITDWEIRCYCQPTQTGLNLYTNWDGEVDTTLASTLFSFMRIGLNQADQRSVFENTLHIRGDMQTGQTLRDIVADMDIDWEHHLGYIIGSTPAYHLGKFAQRIKHNLSATATALIVKPATTFTTKHGYSLYKMKSTISINRSTHCATTSNVSPPP